MRLISALLAPALAACALSFAGPALAQDTPSEPAIQDEEMRAPPTPVETVQVPAEAVELGGPALWMLSDEDTTIYLFGTVHALPADVDWYGGAIADALVAADTIVTEIQVDDSMAAEMQQLVSTRGILPEGETLRGLMTQEQKASFEEAMAKIGLPPAAFDRFEPWYAGMMMSMMPLLQQGYSPEAGVEAVLAREAGEKARAELETLEFQIGVFDTLPLDTQLRFLLETAGAVDEIKPLLDAMVAEWLKGDADALARLMNEGLSDPVLAEALLFNRNANWAVWLDDRMDEPGVLFVAVGAGHLAGERSVQDLLAQRGFTITRIQ